MKIIFIAPYPSEGASTRYRIEQFIPYLKQEGIQCAISYFISPGFYRILYKKGYFFKKSCFFIISTIKRLWDAINALRYDIIFVHLEVYPFGPPLFEYFWAILGKRIIYDLDDAIYLKNASKANWVLRSLKCPSKIPLLIRWSKRVIVCNFYLKEYATRFTDESKIEVIHTSIDTEKFIPLNNKSEKEKLTIGWIGSHSTAIYLERLTAILQKLSRKYNFVLRIIGAGSAVNIPEVGIENLEWTLKNDIENFQSLDIGIYPLIDCEWIKGKTGFKTIQYMSVGVPCVVSNVGSNKEIVSDGVNGFLADTDDEWMEKLSLLIDDRQLRQKIGEAGRNTVEERYSLKINAPKMLRIIQQVIQAA